LIVGFISKPMCNNIYVGGINGFQLHGKIPPICLVDL
jgi:hypothetical protein